MANRRTTLPRDAAVIAISGLVAIVTAALTAPPLAALLIAATYMVTANAVLRILKMLEAAVRHIDTLEQRERDRG